MTFQLDTKIALLSITINDLKDRYFEGQKLTQEELLAIQNYDKFRLEYLCSANDGKEFDRRYLELQAKANLSPYTDFL